MVLKELEYVVYIVIKRMEKIKKASSTSRRVNPLSDLQRDRTALPPVFLSVFSTFSLQ
jgi:hypothetical protein